MTQDTFLSIRNISKQYPGVLALDQVSFDIKRGETMALIGENGAGKSTLIKVLSGAIVPSEGELEFQEGTYTQMTPMLSRSLGVEVIYQEMNLMNSLTVAENVFAGNLPKSKAGLFDKKAMIQKTKEVFARMNVEIDPEAVVENLPIAYMQMVEIAKALSKDVRLLIMDEPTAPLTKKEVGTLMDIVRTLKKQGVTIIFISHRLDEIFEICDRVTVLRDGKWIMTGAIADMTQADLIRYMVGRELRDTYPQRTNPIGETVLELRDFSGNGVKNINFELHRGEVLGMAGLVGAGRTEIIRALYGADPATGGQALLHGKPVKFRSPRDAVRHGVVLLPEDRKREGLVLFLPIAQNISLPNLGRVSSSIKTLRRRAEKRMVDKQMKDLRVAAFSAEQIAGTLSGGNQQKVVLAKWLASDAEVFIFDEPTRGIDVGAKQEIYKLMNDLCAAGKAIIMISSEMEESLGMSDRLVVLYEGQQMGVLEKEEFSQVAVLTLASGAKGVAHHE